MTTVPRGVDAYRRTQAQSSSPLGLVVMLYDGAIRFTMEARDAIARNDSAARANAVSRTMAIVAELQNTLNMKDGGEIARELDRLYSYMNTRLLHITARGDDAAAEEVLNLLRSLRDSWSQIASGAAVARR